MKTKDSKQDRLRGKVKGIIAEAQGYIDDEVILEKARIRSTDKVLALFQKYALEIIGEDEHENSRADYHHIGRNQLRQELRAKLKELV